MDSPCAAEYLGCARPDIPAIRRLPHHHIKPTSGTYRRPLPVALFQQSSLHLPELAPVLGEKPDIRCRTGTGESYPQINSDLHQGVSLTLLNLFLINFLGQALHCILG